MFSKLIEFFRPKKTEIEIDLTKIDVSNYLEPFLSPSLTLLSNRSIADILNGAKQFVNKSNENQVNLGILPDEIWLLIISNLEVKDIMNIMVACKFFGEITNSPSIRTKINDHKQITQRNRLIASCAFPTELNRLIAPCTFPIDLQAFNQSQSYDAFFRHNPSVMRMLDNHTTFVVHPQENAERYQPGEKGFVMK